MSKTILDKVSKEMSGGVETFKKELKRMYRPDVVGSYRAIIAINGVELKFQTDNFDDLVRAVFQSKSKDRLKFRITTRTVYVY